MDKEKKDWSWLPAQMPGVRRLMAEKRRTLGDAHVNKCWQRGVVLCERGWFYAVEGALAVGTPFDDPAMNDPAFVAMLAEAHLRGRPLLVLRTQEVASGAH